MSEMNQSAGAPAASPARGAGSPRVEAASGPGEAKRRAADEPAPAAPAAEPRAPAEPIAAVDFDGGAQSGAGGAARLQLILRKEAAIPGVYPFVTLGANGRYARVHLARVVGADGVPLRYLALKIQRDRYDVETDRGSALTNEGIAQLWEKEFRNLLKLRGLDDSPAVEYLGPETLAARPPLIYCRRCQKFFSPPCPACGDVLRDCEDNGLLTRRGLARHNGGNIRYLFCENCHATNPAAALYRHQASDRERQAGVKDFKALCDEWVGRGEAGGKQPRLCGCPVSRQKAAPGEGSVLTPLSFHNFRVLPLEAMRLHYDEFADCLGGINWNDFLAEHRGGREGVPESLFLADFRGQLSRADRYLFAGSEGAEALEVFRLKLVLFTQLCRRVRDLHEKLGEPHLDLKPENVMVEIPPVSRELPFLWNFRVKLLDLAATSDATLGEDRAARSLPAPPVNYSELYTSPIIRQGQFGHMKSCDIQFSGLKELEGGKYRLSARLRSSELIADEYTDKDVFRISVSQPEAGDPFSFWAAKATAAESTPGLMDVVADGIELSPGSAASIPCLGTTWLRNVNFETYHSFAFPCDLYSLGVILLRTLLSGKRQNMAVVTTRFLTPVLHELARLKDARSSAAAGATGAAGASGAAGAAASASGIFSADLARDLTSRVREMLAANPCARPEMVFWDGDAGRPNAIPADLWYDALLVAVRLCTTLPGFSFCAGRGDFNRDRPAQASEKLLGELERLGARIHSVLFSREEHHRLVREAVDRLKARLGPAKPGAAAAALAAPRREEEILDVQAAIACAAEKERRSDRTRRLAAVEEGIRGRIASLAPAEARAVLDALEARFPVRASAAEEECANLQRQLQAEKARAEALEGKLRALDERLQRGGSDEVRQCMEKLAGEGRQGSDDPRRLAAIAVVLADNVNRGIIGYANVILNSFELKEQPFPQLKESLAALIQLPPKELSEKLKGDLERARSLVRAAIRAVMDYTPKWCESAQGRFAGERFEQASGRGKPWDRYVEFMQSYNFRQDLMQSLRTFIDGERQRPQ